MNNLKRLSVVVLICIVQKVYCLHLAVTPLHIEPGTTRILIVNCSLDVQSTPHLAQLNSLVLSRFVDVVDSSDHHVVASINSVDGMVKVYTGDGVGSGLINNKGASYLSVQWAFPFPDMAGKYICEANGLSLSMILKTLAVSANVSSRELSLNLLSQQLRICKVDNLRRIEENSQLNKKVDILQDNVTKSTEFINKMNHETLASLKTLFIESLPYNGRRYYLNRQSGMVLSTMAEVTCARYGGYLAEIDDENEFQFVRRFLNSNNRSYIAVMISGTDQGHEGYWVYPRHSSAMKYIKWGKYDPNGGASANCLVLYQPLEWTFADQTCVVTSVDNGFLCEIVQQ